MQKRASQRQGLGILPAWLVVLAIRYTRIYSVPAGRGAGAALAAAAAVVANSSDDLKVVP
jgi:hypothetical protein